MPQDIAGSGIFQVEVGMVRQIDESRLIGFRSVLDLQFVVVRKSVNHLAAKIARIIFLPIFARIRQLEGRSFGRVQLFSLPDDFIESFATAMQGVLSVVLRKLIVDTADRESALCDSIAIAADQGTEIRGVADIIV